MSSTGVDDLPQSIIPSTDSSEAFELPETAPDLARPDQHAEVEAAMHLLKPEEPKEEPQETPPEEPKDKEEPTKEPETPEAPPQDSQAELLARIAKSERKLLDEKAALKADREALEAKKKELEELLADDKEELEDFIKDLRESPITQLTKLGFSHDDIANMLLKGEGQTARPQATSSLEEKLLAKIESLEQTIANDKAERERQQSEASIQQQVQEYKNSLKGLLETEEYSLLNTMPNATHEIMNFATGIMQQKNQYLQPKEAADMMLEHYKAHLSQLSSNPIARQLLGLSSEEAKPEAKPTEEKQQPSPTLTHSMQEAPVREKEPELGMFETEHQEIQAALSKVPEGIWETME